MSKIQWWSQPRCAEVVRRIRGRDSQETFARVLGVRIAALSRWENGHTTPTPVYRRLLEDAARRRKVRLS